MPEAFRRVGFSRFLPDLERIHMAIFSHLCQPLQTEAKQQIFQQHSRGDSAKTLAQRFCRTSASIYRIIKGIRAARIMKLPLDSMGNEEFACLRSAKREREILGPPPEIGLPAKKPRVASGLPAYLASMYDVPLLTREQEAHLFRKMNYLKYEANRLRDTLDVDRPRSCLMDQIEKLYDESVATKHHIVRANLRLVVSIAKRYVAPGADFFELVSDGNISLIRAAEKFDVSRGNRFSTYASWAIMKKFARTVPRELRHRDHFRSSRLETFDACEDHGVGQYEQESAQIERESRVEGILRRLDERERQVVVSRFGLTRGQEPLTLKQVGVALGVTKERARQIQCRAMHKLRMAAAEDGIEALEAMTPGNRITNYQF
jgi:RNA polymerase primary sigma factor